MTDTEVLQNDLKEMLRALGLFDGDRPQSPHEVFQECIAEVKRIKAREPKNILDRIKRAQSTLRDAGALLDMYYISPRSSPQDTTETSNGRARREA